MSAIKVVQQVVWYIVKIFYKQEFSVQEQKFLIN